jgi:hypothetical protein
MRSRTQARRAERDAPGAAAEPGRRGRLSAGDAVGGARTTRSPRRRSPSGHAHGLAAHRDHVALVQLATATRLRLAVDRHAVLDQECLCLGARVDEPGQLQELAEPDRVAAYLYVAQR